MTIDPTTSEAPIVRCPVCASVVGDSTGGACACCGWLSWFMWDDLGEIQILRPNGDLLHSEPLQAFLHAFTPSPGARFVLDLADVQYISSAALSKLLVLRKRVLGVKGRLILRSVHSDLWEVFRVTRLDTFFEIES